MIKSIVKMLFLCSIIALFMIGYGCVTKSNDYTCGALYFMLSDRTLKDTIRKAQNGDGVAAYAVYKHYALGYADIKIGDYWLRVSAGLGNEFAIALLQQLEESAQNASPELPTEVIDNPFGTDP